jgi:hypothetical protein
MFFVFVFGIPLVSIYIDKKRRSKIPRMTTTELQQMAVKRPLLYSNIIIKELLSRSEDIGFALPLYLEMACSKKLLNKQIGWAGLKTYFSKTLTEINFTETQPSQATLNQLRLLETKFSDSEGRNNGDTNRFK